MTAARIVRPDHVSPTPNGFVTEASTIGLRPGEWPDALELDGVTYGRLAVDAVAGALYTANVRDGRAASVRQLAVLND